jgi:hypothetical protein
MRDMRRLAIVLLLFCGFGWAADECRHGEVRVPSRTIAGIEIRFTLGGPDAYEICIATAIDRNGGKLFEVKDMWLEVDNASGGDVDNDRSPDLILVGYSGGAHCCWTTWVASGGSRPRLLLAVSNQQPITFKKGNGGKTVLETRDGGFDYFELSHAESFMPKLFLLLTDKGLRNVSAQYNREFDKEIRQARRALTPALAASFRATTDQGGRIKNSEAVRLVISIVVSYLYSGREAEAWKALGELWPRNDRDRIKAKILAARARGLYGNIEHAKTSASGAIFVGVSPE